MAGKLIKQVHKKLINSNKTISVAESCTGGLLSCLLTELSGSSKYFLAGIISYSNNSKQKILNIPAKIITKYGAVSCETSILMAKNIRKLTNSDFSLSITGIAGPKGASKSKPVGTVFICLAEKNGNICRKFLFSGSRQQIRKKSAKTALNLLCARLSL